uniref:Centrosome and spindle pole-associated protein 1-like n=1 Tax=Petromyzon marinus TaxID=7757 RepID=A0AAJ7T1B0_PETMA|nr:centrosome and spindle pole-associated protein 1-like [Petromyzon marinus]
MSWDMLALMMSPRAAAPHPAPPPPLVMDSTRTPYDEAYFFYGAHDPLDPSLTHRGRPFEVQHSADDLAPYRHRQQGPGASVAVPAPQRVTAVSGARRAVGPTSQLGSDFVPGSADRGKQREKHQRYQEELEEQMRVQDVRRQRQREERERYESRIEEEASAFSPWGKGGGGAPLRDAEGNLITDLKQMHKQNEEAYKNPHHRPRGDARAVLSLDLNLATPRADMGEGGNSPHKYPGFGYAYRGALQHAGPVTEQQARAQGLYKDFLKQQARELPGTRPRDRRSRAPRGPVERERGATPSLSCRLSFACDR